MNDITYDKVGNHLYSIGLGVRLNRKFETFLLF